MTVDQQELTATQRSFQDLRLDIGNLKVTEYRVQRCRAQADHFFGRETARRRL